jgi:hypothetical protein
MKQQQKDETENQKMFLLTQEMVQLLGVIIGREIDVNLKSKIEKRM